MDPITALSLAASQLDRRTSAPASMPAPYEIDDLRSTRESTTQHARPRPSPPAQMVGPQAGTQ